VVAQTWLCPNNLTWFKANYVLCMGPLMSAIVVWHNSLVFHSLDKLTSFFLHAFPPLTLHLYRWGLIPSEIPVDSSLSVVEWLVNPLCLYLVWQLAYHIVTEILLKKRLDNDPDMIISIRYLCRDKKNGMRNQVEKILRKFGILKKGDDLNPEELLSKIVFAITQFLYTLVTILPAMLLYGNYGISCCYIFFLYGWGTWNGASYYIEIFSERYKLKFVKISEKEDHDDHVHEDDSGDESDNYENALDTLDENDELYKTIMVALQEGVGQTDAHDVKADVNDDGCDGDGGDGDEKTDEVPGLLEEASKESARSSESSSEATTESDKSSWEKLE